MRILVDMDGVIANFEKGVLDTYRDRHPDKPFVPLEQRTSFYVKEQYPHELQPLVEEIYLAQSFYLNLTPIEGSLEALSELASRGDEIYICTSPLLSNPFCVQEKYDWVLNHLGKDWIKRMILSKDKTIIQGDLLIDDKPEVKGVQQPTWEHILYSQPHNAHVNSKRRMTWQNWKSVIDAPTRMNNMRSPALPDKQAYFEFCWSLTLGIYEVFLERSGRKIWEKCEPSIFTLNSCYLSRRLKGGEPARRPTEGTVEFSPFFPN